MLEVALADQTAAAFNPFHGGVVPSNVERTWVDVYRKNESDLLMFDLKSRTMIYLICLVEALACFLGLSIEKSPLQT